MSTYQIELKTLPAYQVVAVKGTAQDYRHVAQPMNQMFEVIAQGLKNNHLKFAQPCMVLWHNDYRSESQIILEVANGFIGESPKDFQSVQAEYLTEIPSLQAACTIHRGSTELFGDAYAALLAWIDTNGYTPNGAVREVYLHVGKVEAENTTELQIPVRQ